MVCVCVYVFVNVSVNGRFGVDECTSASILCDQMDKVRERKRDRENGMRVKRERESQ